MTRREYDARERERSLETQRVQAIESLAALPQGLLTKFDVTRHPNANSHKRVMEWRPGALGLLISGPTGRGKSRSLFQLIQRLAGEGRLVRYWSVPRLSDRISAGALESVAELDQFLRRLETCSILALDDLGAHRPSERVANAFHRVIDSRYAAELPVLLTTNCSPPELQQQLLDGHGRTIRRLKEMTAAVHF